MVADLVSQAPHQIRNHVGLAGSDEEAPRAALGTSG